MKILHVLPYCPVPANYGGRLRIYNLLRQMARNNDVTVAFVGTEEDADRLRHDFSGKLEKVIACPNQAARKMIRLAGIYSLLSKHSLLYYLGVNRALEKAVLDELDRHDYDIVQTEFPHMAFFDIPGGPVKILDAHNIEHDNFRRMAEKGRSPLRRLQYYCEYRKFRVEELDAFRRQDLLLFTSERDRDIADSDLPEIPKTVIPNGVDSRYFSPPDIEPEPFSMVYVGMMQYVPNADGMLHFLDHIFPLILAKEPRAKITIVGAAPPPELRRRASRNVIITGYVDDVRPHVYRGQVTVVPLRMGGGTRLKILESLAMMSPVVTTPIGGEGIALEHGYSALIADNPRAFADAVVRLFADRALRDRLARNGYELMMKRYEWSVVGDALELAYRDALSAGLERVGLHAR